MQIGADLLGRRMVAGAEPLGHVPTHSDTRNNGPDAFVSRIGATLSLNTGPSSGLIIRYGGRIFGGVMMDLLEDEVTAAICPAAEVIVRYHTAETGHPDRVAHMLIRHPGNGGWAEICADWE